MCLLFVCFWPDELPFSNDRGEYFFLELSMGLIYNGMVINARLYIKKIKNILGKILVSFKYEFSYVTRVQ